ncbi:hypothetical protein ACH41H_46065 [Streptomyces sp. NPDC020800]|uniref:hypothetical protein n=1 Tax=Streptomyces sp. NPDC020800 TaxID=3365092 RepID=UPI0037A36FFB
MWVAAFVLRTHSHRRIAECLEPYGLRTEKAATRTFPQRRFTSRQEPRYAIDAVTAAGEDPQPRETHAYFHTTPYLSRSAADAAEAPLVTLVQAF